EVDSHVGRGAAVRLYVDMLGTEELLGPLDGQALDHVDDLAAAVVALARIAFGVFVGEDASGCFEDRPADEVLGRDQLEPGILAFLFGLDGLKDLRIHDLERTTLRPLGLLCLDILADQRSFRQSRLLPARWAAPRASRPSPACRPSWPEPSWGRAS